MFELLLIVGYIIFVIIRASLEEAPRRINRNRVRQLARETALNTAQNFLAPYSDMWGTLTLENKFCKVTFHAKWKFISCKSKEISNDIYKRFKAKPYGNVDLNPIWNEICMEFNETTKYADIKRVLNQIALITESIVNITNEKHEQPQNTDTPVVPVARNKINVNTATAEELLKLPGISAILAKKIVQYREREREFTSVVDFFKVMGIKRHFQAKLVDLITAEKTGFKFEIRRKDDSDERTVDL